MAKRFTDTGKWDKQWFRKLDPVDKCLWLFLCDRCDHAGVWEIDTDAFEYFVGIEVSLSHLAQAFGDKIEFVGDDKLIIKSFIDFQYGNLNPDNRVHKSVLNRLDKLAPSKALISPFLGAKDKDKDKDKDKEKEKGECEGVSKSDIEAVYRAHYPLKKGKSAGLKALSKQIKSKQDLEDFTRAVQVYAEEVKGREPDKIKHFSTFVNSGWRDCLDPTYGSASTSVGVDWSKYGGIAK